MSAYDPRLVGDFINMIGKTLPSDEWEEFFMGNGPDILQQLRAAAERIERLERALTLALPFVHVYYSKQAGEVMDIIANARAALSTDQGGDKP